MRLTRTLIFALMATALLCSCSNNDEKQTDSGKIDTMAKEVAQEAALMIKTPLDKARVAADLEAKRIRDMEKRDSQ